MNCTSTLSSVLSKPQRNHVDIALRFFLLLWFLSELRRNLSQFILFIIPVSEGAECIQYFVIRKAYFTDDSLPVCLQENWLRLGIFLSLKKCYVNFKIVSLFNNFVFRTDLKHWQKCLDNKTKYRETRHSDTNLLIMLIILFCRSYGLLLTNKPRWDLWQRRLQRIYSVTYELPQCFVSLCYVISRYTIKRNFKTFLRWILYRISTKSVSTLSTQAEMRKGWLEIHWRPL